MLQSGEFLDLAVHREPSLHLAKIAVRVGQAAWRQRFESRSSDEIRHVFDTDLPEKTLHHMRGAAKVGRFVGVVAQVSDGETGANAGIVWGADDMSGSIVQRAVKRHYYHKKPYVWLAQSNVLPVYQRNQISAAMVDTFLNEFDEDQIPTVYVFDENKPTLRWYRDVLGYTPRPAEPVELPYFGSEAAPARQLRLEARRVASVRRRIAQRYNTLPTDTITVIGG